MFNLEYYHSVDSVQCLQINHILLKYSLIDILLKYSLIDILLAKYHNIRYLQFLVQGYSQRMRL